MVFITSTKGTWERTARKSSGRRLATAPISRPPAEPPSMATRVGIAVAGGGQVLDGGDEVGEGVALDEHLAGVVPGLAQVAAAADVRIGHHHAAIEQAQPVGAEAERQRVAIGAVAVDVERIAGPVGG